MRVDQLTIVFVILLEPVLVSTFKHRADRWQIKPLVDFFPVILCNKMILFTFAVDVKIMDNSEKYLKIFHSSVDDRLT
jgi:hypothetical protein